MLFRILVTLTILIPEALRGQVIAEDVQKEKYNSMLLWYNQRLDAVNRQLLQLDSASASTVLFANNRLYYRLVELDTSAAKPLIAENVKALDYFLLLLKSDTASAETKKASVRFFQENAAWFDRQFQNAALEGCTECFLSRKIKITVLRRISDQRLDTIRCVPVDCKKVLLGGAFAKNVTAVSYPCPESERILSTGPKYQFIVSYDGKTETFEYSVDVGSALTDIQRISLIVPKQ